MENWKQIRDYNYEANENGDIRNIKTGRIISQRKMKQGYLLVDIQVNKKGKTFRAHRLIAETFLGEGKEGSHVDHKNRVRYDNRIENLRWVTPSENNKNRKFGELTIEGLEEIIKLSKEGKTTDEIFEIISN